MGSWIALKLAMELGMRIEHRIFFFFFLVFLQRSFVLWSRQEVGLNETVVGIKMEKRMIFLIVLQRRLNIAVQLIMELTARTNIEGTYLLVFSKYLFALRNIAIMLFQLELD